jgi:hypothetical protein
MEASLTMSPAQKNEYLDPFDTIVVPSHPKGFGEVFLGENRWPNLKVDRKRLLKLTYIAVYQTRPVSAITHYAKIENYEPLDRAGRYNIFFSENPIEIEPVKFTSADICAVQGPRYTTLSLILQAKSISRAFHN